MKKLKYADYESAALPLSYKASLTITLYIGDGLDCFLKNCILIRDTHFVTSGI